MVQLQPAAAAGAAAGAAAAAVPSAVFGLLHVAAAAPRRERVVLIVRGIRAGGQLPRPRDRELRGRRAQLHVVRLQPAAAAGAAPGAAAAAVPSTEHGMLHVAAAARVVLVVRGILARGQLARPLDGELRERRAQLHVVQL